MAVRWYARRQDPKRSPKLLRRLLHASRLTQLARAVTAGITLEAVFHIELGQHARLLNAGVHSNRIHRLKT